MPNEIYLIYYLYHPMHDFIQTSLCNRFLNAYICHTYTKPIKGIPIPYHVTFVSAVLIEDFDKDYNKDSR